MNEIILIPDVHCRNFWKPVLNIKDKKIVFLGDYLDPYDYEGFTFKEGLNNLKEIIQFKKENCQRVTLLLGNHDFNSLWQKNWASRFTSCPEAFNLYKDNLNLFDPYKVIDNTLFTHAGISNGWCKSHNIKDIINFLDSQWNEFLKHPYEESYLPIFDCGRARWGFQRYGGIFWNDLSEVYVNPIDYIQITGHNQLENTGSFVEMSKYRKQFTGKPFYCIDSRAIFIWNNEELKLYD